MDVQQIQTKLIGELTKHTILVGSLGFHSYGEMLFGGDDNCKVELFFLVWPNTIFEKRQRDMITLNEPKACFTEVVITYHSWMFT